MRIKINLLNQSLNLVTEILLMSFLNMLSSTKYFLIERQKWFNKNTECQLFLSN